MLSWDISKIYREVMFQFTWEWMFLNHSNNRNSGPDMFCKKGGLRNFAKLTGKHLCQGHFFNKVAGLACNFIKKVTLAQVFSCKFCKIAKNTFSYRTPLMAA